MSKLPLHQAPLRAVVTTVFLALAGFWAAPRAQAQANPNPPERMSYQGFLVDGNGTALATNAPKNYDVVFRIWNDASAAAVGNRLWTEQQTVTVDKGYFSVLLGEGTQVTSPSTEARPNLSTLFTNATASERYVEMTVKGIGAGNSDVTMLPRIRLLTAPYAYLASKVAGIAGAVPDAALSVNIARLSGGFLPDSSLNANIARLDRANQTFTQPVKFPSASAQGLSPSWDLINSTGASKASLGLAGGNGAWSSSAEIGDTILRTTDLAQKIILQNSSGAAALTIKNNLVGIGTANPRTRLHVDAGVDASLANGAGFLVIGSEAGQNIVFDNNEIIARNNGAASHLYLNSESGNGNTILNEVSGYVGIGTRGAAPVAPLDVREGILGRTVTGKYFNASTGTSFASFNNELQYVSIKSEWYVEAFGFIAVSDGRIKDVVRPSDPATDLETIQQLAVTDYRMKDRVQSGDALHKGFIAQEVQKVIPEAVRKAPGYVPSIFEVARQITFNRTAQSLTITLGKAHALKAGDRVRLLGDDATHEVKVTEVTDPMTFVAGPFKTQPERLFVYGKQVEDFLSVDYDRIFTTGIGAIQELARRLEQKAARVDALERDLADLKKLVAQLAPGGPGSRQAAQAPHPAPAPHEAELTGSTAPDRSDR